MRVWITRDYCSYNLHVAEPDWNEYLSFWLGGEEISEGQARSLLGRDLKLNEKKRIAIGRIK